MQNSCLGTVNQAKYENAILFLCWNQPNHRLVGKKKLAKLLYYVDFDRFEYKESMQTVTGDTYYRLPMGPVPEVFEQVTKALELKKDLRLGSHSYGEEYRDAKVYEATHAPNLSVFDEDDLFILERVIRVHGSKTGAELEEQTHREAPWRSADMSEEIIPATAFYRETNFAA